MINVGIIYDDFNEDVQVQVVRDLLILAGQWDIQVNDQGKMLPNELLDQLQCKSTEDKPDLYVVYKTTEEWPKYPNEGVEVVKRDMKPDDASIGLDPNPRVGYFLKPQGRGYTNRTEMYLNRRHPQGKGVINPWVSLIWGP